MSFYIKGEEPVEIEIIKKQGLKPAPFSPSFVNGFSGEYQLAHLGNGDQDEIKENKDDYSKEIKNKDK